MRKIIQVTSVAINGDAEFTALCNDGTIWHMNAVGRWHELPAIPQDESKDPLAVAVGTFNSIRTHAEIWRDSINATKRAVGVTILGILDRKG